MHADAHLHSPPPPQGVWPTRHPGNPPSQRPLVGGVGGELDPGHPSAERQNTQRQFIGKPLDRVFAGQVVRPNGEDTPLNAPMRQRLWAVCHGQWVISLNRR